MDVKGSRAAVGLAVCALLLMSSCIQVADARPMRNPHRLLEAADLTLEAADISAASSRISSGGNTRALLAAASRGEHTGKDTKLTAALSYTQQHILNAMKEMEGEGGDFKKALEHATSSGMRNARASSSSKMRGTFSDGMKKAKVYLRDDGTDHGFGERK